MTTTTNKIDGPTRRETPVFSETQKETYDRLLSGIISNAGRIGLSEIKRQEIVQFTDRPEIFFFIELGMPNDEGTAASIFARESRHIMIGKKGGCELLNPVKKGRTINRGIYHCINNLAKH